MLIILPNIANFSYMENSAQKWWGSSLIAFGTWKINLCESDCFKGGAAHLGLSTLVDILLFLQGKHTRGLCQYVSALRRLCCQFPCWRDFILHNTYWRVELSTLIFLLKPFTQSSLEKGYLLFCCRWTQTWCHRKGSFSLITQTRRFRVQEGAVCQRKGNGAI